MKNIKNILVALDLSGIDETLIRYTSFLTEQLEPDNVYFVHNIKKYEISKLFEEHLKELNLDELVGDELNEKVQENFKASVNWEVLISEDPYSESLIKYIVEKYACQLVIVGNKKHEKGTGVVSSKLLRLLRCDILAVPRNAENRISEIWAGTDFSQESRKIFGVAKILQENQDVSLKLVHVYNVPVQFSPYVPVEEMGPQVEKHVKEKFKKFLNRVNYFGPLEPLIFLGRESGAAQKLAVKIGESKADMLLLADKGLNTFSPFSVGSLTEEIFNADLEVPLWVVKS